MKHTIIGTAGHIDHGKTMLLKALTDIDADRLPEEQRRGMTIDLGYVFYGPSVSIIDVPGHEKFIKNMLAGITTIDSVILVIAADDGIMPQTREHFDILRLLDVRRGIVVVTKIDLVEPEWLEMVKEEIARFLAGTFLEGAPVACVSSLTGEGIEEFRAMLEREIAEAPSRADKGIFRYWVDRTFVLKGVGNIVTGTILAGTVKAGEKLELLPRGKEVRARNLQAHNEEVTECGVGQRAAINLIGVERGEIERGDMLACPGYYKPTYMVNARLHLLPGSRPLKNRTRVRFHLGCRELFARVVPLGGRTIPPGESAAVQFRLEQSVAVDTGDRYIIRQYSPPVTIGGGTILEVHPKKLKYLPREDLQVLDQLDSEETDKLLIHHLAGAPMEPKTVVVLSRELAVREKEVEDAVDKLVGEGTLTVVTRKPSNAVLLTSELKYTTERVLEYLERYHATKPYLRGIKQSELKNRIVGNAGNQVWEEILNSLATGNEIVLKDETVALAAHSISFSPQNKEPAEKIEKMFRVAEFVTPSVRDVAGEFQSLSESRVENIIRGLIELGRLVEVLPEAGKRLIFHRETIGAAEKVVVDLLRQKGEIRVSEFRDAIGCSRKYATPLLVHFDQRGLTERVGDIRRLKVSQ
ncbi:selenocysteine-specific translation elongation factor [Gemmatimonadota bacterium]